MGCDCVVVVPENFSAGDPWGGGCVDGCCGVDYTGGVGIYICFDFACLPVLLVGCGIEWTSLALDCSRAGIRGVSCAGVVGAGLPSPAPRMGVCIA